MSLLSVQVIDKFPLVLNYVSASSAASGDVVSNIFFDEILCVKNDSGSDTTVNISALTPCDQGDYINISEIVSTGTIGYFPLHSRITYWISKQVTIHVSPVVDVSLAVFRQLR